MDCQDSLESKRELSQPPVLVRPLLNEEFSQLLEMEARKDFPEGRLTESEMLTTVGDAKGSSGSSSSLNDIETNLSLSWPEAKPLKRSKSLERIPNLGQGEKRRLEELPDIWDSKRSCSASAAIMLSTPAGTQDCTENKDKLLKFNATLSQMLWTIQHLEYNPVKTEEELVQTLRMLCSGIQDVLSVLSGSMNFSDREYQRTLRVTEAFFKLIQCKESCSSTPRIMVQVNEKAADLFDAFLDFLSHENENAEGQYQRYAICSSLITYINEGRIRRIFSEKILMRIYWAISKMWKAYCEQKEDLMKCEIIDSHIINLMFFYCQLLEATITSADESSLWIEESFHQNLLWMFENAGSLFVTFPNLSAMFYRVIHASKKHMKEEQSQQD